MNKTIDTKQATIIILVVAILCLSVGFSAFSTALNISSSANVSPDATTFSVVFSSSDSALETNPINPKKSPESIVATPATINNASEPTISNLSATFTEPGQSVTYNFYTRNTGEYDAFLKGITFQNVQSQSATKVCTASPGTTDSLVQAACNDIQISIKVGNESEATATTNNITGHSLLQGSSEPVTVKIEYLSNGARADGDFSVSFGDISLNYSSVD